MAGKTIEDKFNASGRNVFEASRIAIAELGYTILNSDKESLFITFNTGRSFKTMGGQDLTATIVETGSETRVIVGGTLAKGGNIFGGAQLIAWGEKDALSKKFLSKLRETLSTFRESAE